MIDKTKQWRCEIVRPPARLHSSMGTKPTTFEEGSRQHAQLMQRLTQRVAIGLIVILTMLELLVRVMKICVG